MSAEEKHGRQLLKSLGRLRNEEFLSDFTITANGIQFSCHRVVLALCSDYFKAMFSHDLKEVKEGVCELNGVDPYAIEQCLAFMYSAETSLSMKNIANILDVACMLQMHDLEEVCWEFLEMKLGIDNFFFIRKLAFIYHCPNLQNTLHEFAIKNFSVLMEDDDVVQLSASEVVTYVSASQSSPNLREPVWIFVIKWLEHDRLNRNNDLCMILRTLLPTLQKYSVKYIQENIWKHSHVINCTRCQQLIADKILNIVNRRCIGVPEDCCVFIKLLAQRWEKKVVEDEADKCIARHFKSVSTEADFGKVDKNTLVRVLKQFEVKYLQTIYKWNAIVKWVKYDLEDRKRFLNELIGLINLADLPKIFLKEAAQNDPIISENKEYRNLFIDGIYRRTDVRAAAYAYQIRECEPPPVPQAFSEGT